jgi:hypothetical protein
VGVRVEGIGKGVVGGVEAGIEGGVEKRERTGDCIRCTGK